MKRCEELGRVMTTTHDVVECARTFLGNSFSHIVVSIKSTCNYITTQVLSRDIHWIADVHLIAEHPTGHSLDIPRILPMSKMGIRGTVHAR